MTKKELQDELDNFIDSERLDEKSKRTIGDYRNAVNKLIDFLPDEFELNKSLMIDFKEHLTENGFRSEERRVG